MKNFLCNLIYILLRAHGQLVTCMHSATHDYESSHRVGSTESSRIPLGLWSAGEFTRECFNHHLIGWCCAWLINVYLQQGAGEEETFSSALWRIWCHSSLSRLLGCASSLSPIFPFPYPFPPSIMSNYFAFSKRHWKKNLVIVAEFWGDYKFSKRHWEGNPVIVAEFCGVIIIFPRHWKGNPVIVAEFCGVITNFMSCV